MWWNFIIHNMFLSKLFKFNSYFSSFNSVYIIYYNNILNSLNRYLFIQGILGSFFYKISNFSFFNLYYKLCYKKYYMLNFFYRLSFRQGTSVDMLFLFKTLSFKYYWEICSKFSLISNSIYNKSYFLNLGLSDKLEITGYARRC